MILIIIKIIILILVITMVAETISQYVSSECSFRGIGVDSVIESLEGNDSERNSLLSDLWEND